MAMGRPTDHGVAGPTLERSFYGSADRCSGGRCEPGVLGAGIPLQRRPLGKHRGQRDSRTLCNWQQPMLTIRHHRMCDRAESATEPLDPQTLTLPFNLRVRALP